MYLIGYTMCVYCVCIVCEIDADLRKLGFIYMLKYLGMDMIDGYIYVYLCV